MTVIGVWELGNLLSCALFKVQNLNVLAVFGIFVAGENAGRNACVTPLGNQIVVELVQWEQIRIQKSVLAMEASKIVRLHQKTGEKSLLLGAQIVNRVAVRPIS
jgi:hypothetical protein